MLLLSLFLAGGLQGAHDHADMAVLACAAAAPLIDLHVSSSRYFADHDLDALLVTGQPNDGTSGFAITLLCLYDRQLDAVELQPLSVDLS